MTRRLLVIQARNAHRTEMLCLGIARHDDRGWHFIPMVTGRQSSRKPHATFQKCLPRWTGGLDRTESFPLLPGESISDAISRKEAEEKAAEARVDAAARGGRPKGLQVDFTARWITEDQAVLVAYIMRDTDCLASQDLMEDRPMLVETLCDIRCAQFMKLAQALHPGIQVGEVRLTGDWPRPRNAHVAERLARVQAAI